MTPSAALPTLKPAWFPRRHTRTETLRHDIAQAIVDNDPGPVVQDGICPTPPAGNSRIRLISRCGGAPNRRLYSRLNCETLS